MKGIIASVLLATLSASAGAAEPVIDRSWLKVDENHAVLNHDGADYVLDSYIVMFQQPYYIHVRLKEGQPVDLAKAEAIAADYIKPRGCTQPLERRADLDRSNAGGTERVLGFQC